jgi:hypothetical protein
MGWCTMGCPASGNSGLGTFSDSGRNRVPASNEGRAGQAIERGEVRGADLCTFGWAADHDDGDDALLGAGHACAALHRAKRAC